MSTPEARGGPRAGPLVIDAAHAGFADHLLDGWHGVEPWGVWSAATSARLLVPLRAGSGAATHELRVTLNPSPTGGPCVGARVLMNGVALRPCAAGEGGASGFTGVVAGAGPALVLTFTVEALVSPAALGPSADRRELGLALVRVEVTSADEAAAAVPPVAAGATTWRPASELLHADRLDLVVKARYFQALASGRGVARARERYLRHIELRTGGREPPDYRGQASPKRSLEDHELACRALLLSMRRDGFDPGHAVPRGESGRPLNGAHRIACALALGMDVAVSQEPRQAGTWDIEWFRRAGYTKRERLQLLFDLVRLAPERCSVFVLWPQLVDVWDEAVAAMRARGFAVAGHVDLAWPEPARAAYESLVFDLYSHGVTDFAGGFGHIERKLQFLRLKPCFLRVGVCMLGAGEAGSWAGIPALKAALREQHAARAPVDQFVSCHFGDTVAESQHLARTVLCPENLDWLLARPAAQPRAAFLGWLNDYAATLRQQGLDPEDCCIVGSAGLEIQGLRLSTDIDFTVRESIRALRFTPGVTRFGAGVDLVTRGYHRKLDGPAHSDDDVIDDPALHLRFRGFKVAVPPLIRDRKATQGRPKDLLDVELLDAAAVPRFADGA